MQNSEPCMFCRYRKARLAAACCAAGSTAPAQAQDKDQPTSTTASAAPERTMPEPARHDTPEFA